MVLFNVLFQCSGTLELLATQPADPVGTFAEPTTVADSSVPILEMLGQLYTRGKILAADVADLDRGRSGSGDRLARVFSAAGQAVEFFFPRLHLEIGMLVKLGQ